MKKVINLLPILLLMSNLSFGQFKTVGYVPNWVNLYTFSDNFDFSRVTHLNLAFKNPTNTTGDLPGLSASEVYLIAKAHDNGVKVLMSIGGGNASENATTRNYYFTLINSTNRAMFCSKLKAYTLSNNLDGLDIDLEGPAINSSYGAFIQVLADSLHPVNLLITSALSEGYGGGNVPQSTFAYFDWINLMAYDAVGPTWGTPGQHSSYLYAQNELNYWKGRGLPKLKAVLGVPFYGYGFGASYRSYAYAFNEIANSYLGDIYDDEAGNTIYYNGINTIIDKTSLALVQGGGIMIWELSLDAAGNNSLLKSIRSTVLATSIENEKQNDLFSIFPNPTNGLIEIKGDIDNEVAVEVFNSIGELLAIKPDNGNLDLSTYPKGLYQITITKRKQKISKKIIVN